MSDSVVSEIQHDYEDRMRSSLCIILWNAFHIAVSEPYQGFNKSYYMEEYPEIWPRNLPSPVEIDFMGQTKDLKMIRSYMNHEMKDNPDVVISVSPIVNADQHPSLFSEEDEISVNKYDDNYSTKSRFSEKSEVDTRGHFKYVIAEITMGGRKSISKKVEQLEKDCIVSIMELNRKDVLDAVSIAIIVSPVNYAEYAFNFINSNGKYYPNVLTLFEAGRIVYIQNKETLSYTTRKLQTDLSLFQDDVKEEIEILKSEISQVKVDLNEGLFALSSKMDSILELLGQKSNENNEITEKFKNKQDKINDDQKSSF